MILNGWTVREEYSDNLYYVGMNADNKPIFEPLNSKTRTYIKGERAAQCACQRIRETGYEGNPHPFFLDNVEIPDAPPQDKPVEVSQQEEPERSEDESLYDYITTEVLKPPPGWRILDCFGRYLALLYDRQHFAIRYKDGSSKLYDTATEAAKEWSRIRSEVLIARVNKLGGAG